MIDAETKGIINDLVNKFVRMLSLNPLIQKVNEILTQEYDKGIEREEKNFDMNFLRNEERLTSLQKYTFDNIKDLNDDMANKLRAELQRSMLNLESIPKMKERVKKVMDVSEVRATAIARTESIRATNMGRIDGARQTGLKLVKWVNVHMDSRTSPICTRMNAKYGIRAKGIPLDDKFVDNTSGEEFDIPPFHVNCRTNILYDTPIKDEE